MFKFNLSASTINSFRRCPRRWKYDKQHLSGIKVPTDALEYGTTLHNIMVLYFDRVGQKPSKMHIEVMIENAFNDGYTHIIKSFLRRTKKAKKEFLAFELKRLRTWKQYKPTFTEKRIKVKIFDDLPFFTGYVDFYSQADETIIDWKYGRRIEMNEALIIQGKIYELGLIKSGYPVKRAMFVNPPTGKQLTVPKVTDGWLYKVAKQMCDQVEAGRFPPKPTPLCGWCSHIIRCQFNGICLWMAD